MAVPARVHPAVVKAAAVDAVHVFSTAEPAALMLNPADGAQQTAWSVAAQVAEAQFAPAGVVIAYCKCQWMFRWFNDLIKRKKTKRKREKKKKKTLD